MTHVGRTHGVGGVGGLPEGDSAQAAASSPGPAAAPARGGAPGGRMAAASSIGGPATTAPAAALTPPAWYPAGFDLDAAARGAKDILTAEGISPDTIGPGKADKVVFTDVDLTL